MSHYYPLYVNIEKRPILIFGGGNNAREKIEKLMPCGPALTIAAEKVTPSIKKLGEEGKIALIRSNGSDAQVLISRLHPLLVIIADVDADQATGIFQVCRKSGIEVHTVNNRDLSTVLLPSVIWRKHLSVAIFSQASSTAVTRIREHIERSLPSAIDSILENLEGLRKKMKEKVDFKPGQFAAIYGDIFNAALRENRILSAGEMAQIMEKYIDEAK